MERQETRKVGNLGAKEFGETGSLEDGEMGSQEDGNSWFFFNIRVSSKHFG